MSKKPISSLKKPNPTIGALKSKKANNTTSTTSTTSKESLQNKYDLGKNKAVDLFGDVVEVKTSPPIKCEEGDILCKLKTDVNQIIHSYKLPIDDPTFGHLLPVPDVMPFDTNVLPKCKGETIYKPLPLDPRKKRSLPSKTNRGS